MKRFLALVLVAMMVMPLAACGKTEDKTAGDNGDYIPDFSDHTDPAEEEYWTRLIDLSQLGDGEKHLVFETEPFAWYMHSFDERPEEESDFCYDVRYTDLSDMNLSFVDNVHKLHYDNHTIWPEELPDGFDPEAILELNKNPGLHIRDLHEQGVTGKGVGIAIIDQGLYTEHVEYKDNLKSYEVIHCADQDDSYFHGTGVAGVAVGKTVGVAPEADLYFVASTFSHDGGESRKFDASIIAECVLRVCDINKYLPEENRIRVISISRGYDTWLPGYDELQEAIKKADEQGIFVLTTSTKNYYDDFDLQGLSKSYTADPDDISSFTPVIMNDKPDGDPSACVFFPRFSRTSASWTGPENYEINYECGLSWAVPWCAGFYALCCQVDPDITPGEFIDLVKNTAYEYPRQFGSETINLKMVNPVAAIDELRK